ncbi:MAG: hypothetical protein ACAI43_06830 [Phycisphaerae bacterium]|nr:hypothetical protein [Tepidisphaeraceae bacterium]
MSAGPTLILPYSADVPSRVRVLARRWVPRLVVVVAIAFAVWLVVSRVRQYVALRAAERTALAKCLQYQRPANEVAFDESAAIESIQYHFPGGTHPVFRSTRGGPDSLVPLIWPVHRPSILPACWHEMEMSRYRYQAFLRSAQPVKCQSGLRLPPPRPTVVVDGRPAKLDTFLFMHELRPPGGEARLVTITFSGPALICEQRRSFAVSVDSLSPRAIPAGLYDDRLTRIECADFPPAGAGPVRLYAGQPDPSRADRFTVRCVAGTAEYTIVGRLHADGTVTLSAAPGVGSVDGGRK